MPGKTVILPGMPGRETYDLAKLNAAMDEIIAAGTQASGRYALVHTHGWAPTEAVKYTNGAQFCFDNFVDPNALPATAHMEPVTAGHPPACGCGECELRRSPAGRETPPVAGS